jgi:hypothetical protein
MQILLDQCIRQSDGLVMGSIYYDTEQLLPKPHQHDKENGTTVLHLLKFFMHHPEHRESAGLNVLSQITGEDSPRTRWDRVIAHTESDEGHPELKTEWEKVKHDKSDKSTDRRSSKSNR